MRRIKKGSAILLAAALVFSALALPKAYAANGVVTDANCSVIVNVTNNVPNTELTELKSKGVKVNLYKVADINVSGNYIALNSVKDAVVTEKEGEASAFPGEEDKSFGTLLSKVSSKTNAAQWEKLAEVAKGAVTAADITATGTTSNGSVKISIEKSETNPNPTGLYLVDAETLKTTNYTYSFKPYLISLPNNYYDAKDATSSDEWIYENVAIGLKPEKNHRLGNLKINKALDEYNETLGGATFVFQVEATKLDVDASTDKTAEVVYSNVVALTYTGPGTQSVIIEDIPAGADVTITEIYTGASYQLKEGAVNPQTTKITADNTVEVTFENTNNDGLNGGSSIINAFSYGNNGWTCSQIPSTDASQE